MIDVPSPERVLEVTQLLPQGLAKEMSTWDPLMQQAVMTGIAVFVNEMEVSGLLADPIQLEDLLSGLAYVLRRRMTLLSRLYDEGLR